MKHVEFLGVEGIGKTTLFNELLRQRKKKDLWVTTEEARIKCARNHLIENDRTVHQKIIDIFLKYNINKWLQYHLCNDVLLPLEQYYLQKPNEAYQKFWLHLEKYYDLSENMPQLGLNRITGLFYLTYKLQYLDKHESQQIFLSENDSISMGGLLLPYWKKSPSEQMIKEFYLHMPSPAGLIYCYLDYYETLTRIRNRQNDGIISFSHRDLNNNTLIVDDNQLSKIIQIQAEIASKGADILKQRGVKVLEVNLEKSLHNNVIKISEFLASFP